MKIILIFIYQFLLCTISTGLPFNDTPEPQSLGQLRGTKPIIEPSKLSLAALASLHDDAIEENESNIIASVVLGTKTFGQTTIPTSTSIPQSSNYENKFRFREQQTTIASPCVDSDAKPTPFELKTQGKDIGDGDKLRKYNNPCKPPPFLVQEKLQAPGLPAVPVPPAVEMNSMFGTNPFSVEESEPVVSDSGDREGLAAAMSVLNGMSTHDWDH